MMGKEACQCHTVLVLPGWNDKRFRVQDEVFHLPLSTAFLELQWSTVIQNCIEVFQLVMLRDSKLASSRNIFQLYRHTEREQCGSLTLTVRVNRLCTPPFRGPRGVWVMEMGLFKLH